MSDDYERDTKGRQATLLNDRLGSLKQKIVSMEVGDSEFANKLEEALAVFFEVRNQWIYNQNMQVPLTPPNPIGATTSVRTSCPKCKATLTVTLS